MLNYGMKGRVTFNHLNKNLVDLIEEKSPHGGKRQCACFAMSITVF
jgi:hypothetical protein